MILFSVLLTSCEKEESKPDPIAVFAMSNTSVGIDETIAFTNYSENATSYSWDFGDGNTSIDEHPTYSYSSEGTYTVTLTATGDGGKDTKTQSIEIIATLSGTWNTTLDVDGAYYDGVYEITQNSDNSLSGSFVFTDGSGYTSISSSSNINGNNVTIVWWLGSYKLTFTGEVNDDFDYMSGSYYNNGYKFGDWTATKASTKSAVIKTENKVNTHMQQFLNSLNK